MPYLVGEDVQLVFRALVVAVIAVGAGLYDADLHRSLSIRKRGTPSARELLSNPNVTVDSNLVKG